MSHTFEIQGHRGARGHKPENTLPGFEAALDLMVSAIETDIHLSKDGVPVLYHDEALSEKLVRVARGARVPKPSSRPLVSSLTRDQLRCYLADRNPDRRRFPDQDRQPTPAAKAFASEKGIPVYGIPTLADFLAFVAAYAGEVGERARKNPTQRAHARRSRFNLELKRVPFRSDQIGDHFDGRRAGALERRMVELVQKAHVSERTTVQCFDHRSVRAVRSLEPKITGAVLVAGTAPVSVVQVVQAADAQVYSPDFTFLDLRQVREAQAAGIRVVPYTVNDEADMERLLDWGVDGMVTDYPRRLMLLLRERHVSY